MRKSTRGGRRPGAGRPPSGLPRAITTSVRLPSDVRDELEAVRQPGEALADVLRKGGRLLARLRRGEDVSQDADL